MALYKVHLYSTDYCFIFYLEARPRDIQGLFLDVCSDVFLAVLREPSVVLGIKLESATYKASTLTLILFFQFLMTSVLIVKEEDNNRGWEVDSFCFLLLKY